MFTEAPYQPPRFRTILGGAIIFGLLLVMVWQLSTVTKSFGYALLYVPAQLGIVHQVGSQEIQKVQVQDDGWVTITVANPGSYLVYFDSFNALQRTDADLATGKPPWLVVQTAATHEPLTIDYVTRGLAIYDTPFAGGRPTFRVNITQAGSYRVWGSKTAALWLVPDYITGHETDTMLAIVGELAILIILSRVLWYGTHRQQYAARKAQKQRVDQRRVQAEAFWQREREQSGKSKH